MWSPHARAFANAQLCPLLETVHLHRLLISNLLLQQERLDSLALVTLELQHLVPRFLVLQHRAVAAMLLLDRLLDLLEIQLLRQARHGCDTLAPVTLLDTNVHLALV